MSDVPALIGWHEVAIAVISILLTVAGWMWTMTVKTVLELKKDFGLHVVEDARNFGAIRTDMAERHVELLKELQTIPRPARRK